MINFEKMSYSNLIRVLVIQVEKFYKSFKIMGLEKNPLDRWQGELWHKSGREGFKLDIFSRWPLEQVLLYIIYGSQFHSTGLNILFDTYQYYLITMFGYW